jgi:hypothetical protein
MVVSVERVLRSQGEMREVLDDGERSISIRIYMLETLYHCFMENSLVQLVGYRLYKA